MGDNAHKILPSYKWGVMSLLIINILYIVLELLCLNNVASKNPIGFEISYLYDLLNPI